jgi:hypothetical protein
MHLHDVVFIVVAVVIIFFMLTPLGILGSRRSRRESPGVPMRGVKSEEEIHGDS